MQYNLQIMQIFHSMCWFNINIWSPQYMYYHYKNEINMILTLLFDGNYYIYEATSLKLISRHYVMVWYWLILPLYFHTSFTSLAQSNHMTAYSCKWSNTEEHEKNDILVF